MTGPTKPLFLAIVELLSVKLLPSGVFNTSFTGEVFVPTVFKDNCKLLDTFEVSDVEDLTKETLVKFFVDFVVV
jgi:hypothetical protein